MDSSSISPLVLASCEDKDKDKSDDELFKDHINKNYSDLRELQIIKECGHWTQQEKPDEVNKILMDFLAKI